MPTKPRHPREREPHNCRRQGAERQPDADLGPPPCRSVRGHTLSPRPASNTARAPKHPREQGDKTFLHQGGVHLIGQWTDRKVPPASAGFYDFEEYDD